MGHACLTCVLGTNLFRLVSFILKDSFSFRWDVNIFRKQVLFNNEIHCTEGDWLWSQIYFLLLLFIILAGKDILSLFAWFVRICLDITCDELNIRQYIISCELQTRQFLTVDSKFSCDTVTETQLTTQYNEIDIILCICSLISNSYILYVFHFYILKCTF